MPDLPWVTNGLSCSGDYRLHFGAVAEGDCETQPVVSGLLAHEIEVLDGAILALLDGSIAADVQFVIRSGELQLVNCLTYTPVIELGGDGPAMLTINGGNTGGIDDILFGHLDNAQHSLCVGGGPLSFNSGIVANGSNALVSMHAGPGGSLAFTGFQGLGAGATYDISATQDALLLCDGAMVLGGAGGSIDIDGSVQMTVNGNVDLGGAGLCNAADSASALVLGTLEVGAGWSVVIADQAVIDADAWSILSGANAVVSVGGTAISFFDPMLVEDGAEIRIDGVLGGQGVALGGKMVVGPGAVVEGPVEATGGEIYLDSLGAGGPPADLGDVFLIAFASLGGNLEALAHFEDFRMYGQATYRPAVGSGAPWPGSTSTRVLCTGTAELDGTLEVALEGSVSAGEEFVILEATAVNGKFATVSDGWSVVYGPTSVMLVADEDMTGGDTPGDVNGDGIVDVTDLLAVLAAWGACADPSDCPADLDGDGTVAVGDLLMVLGNWTV